METKTTSHCLLRCHLFQTKWRTLLNDTHRKKLCFTQFSTRKAPCLLLIFFICLHNQLSSIHSIMTFKEYRCLRKVIHQIYNKNEWLLLSARFTTELELAFVLTLEKTFSQRFHLKANRKSIGSSKKRN